MTFPRAVGSLLCAVPVAVAGAGVLSTAHAQGASHGLFQQGSEEYQRGEYEAAIESFTGVLDAGIDDAAVHYNLANAWFKAGRLGRAIYHYRRAHALAPRDEDIRANLDYARFLVLDQVEEEAPRTDLKVEGWLDRFTAGEVLRAATLLWILAGAFAVLGQLLPVSGGGWRRGMVACGCGWLVVVIFAWTVHHRVTSLSEAVVLPAETRVRNGPGDTFDVAFVLHEGAEVVVEAERGSWTEISLPGDLRGWVASEALARL